MLRICEREDIHSYFVIILFALKLCFEKRFEKYIKRGKKIENLNVTESVFGFNKIHLYIVLCIVLEIIINSLMIS